MAHRDVLSQQSRHPAMTISIERTPHGYLVSGLGGNLDIDIYWESKSKAFQHFLYLLKNGKP